MATGVGVLLHVLSWNDTSTPTGGAMREVHSGPGGGVVMPEVRNGVPYVYVLDTVCSTKGASTVTGVDTIAPKGDGKLTVTEWAVRYHVSQDNPADGVPGRALLLPDFKHQSVTAGCSDASTNDLAITVTLTGAAASSNGFQVRWKNGDSTGSFRIPYEMTECTAKVCPNGLTPNSGLSR